MKKLIFIVALATSYYTNAQSLTLTNWPGAGAILGIGINSSTHKVMEIVNVVAPINQTLSVSIVGVRFGNKEASAYGGGTLNAGFNYDVPIIGIIHPSIGTGAVWNGKMFDSYTAFQTDKLISLTKTLTLTAGLGVAYMPSQTGFDGLAGVGVSWKPSKW